MIPDLHKKICKEDTKMALFNLGKKKEDGKKPACACNTPAEEVKEESCCCQGELSDVGMEGCGCVDTDAGIQSIKVLGTGCKSCHEMYENTKKALKNMELNVEAEYITDMEKVMAYGVMSMPGLVVNEKVVSVGKVLKPADIERLLRKLGF